MDHAWQWTSSQVVARLLKTLNILNPFLLALIIYSSARRRSLAPRRLAFTFSCRKKAVGDYWSPIICAKSQKYIKINSLRDKAAHISTDLLTNIVNNRRSSNSPVSSSRRDVLKSHPEFIRQRRSHCFPLLAPCVLNLYPEINTQPPAPLFSLFSLPLASPTCPCIFLEYFLGDFWVAGDLVPLVAAAVKRHDEGALVIAA